MRTHLKAAVAAVFGAVVAHTVQSRGDEARRVTDEAWELRSMPRHSTVRLATFGQTVLAADLLWVRVVLRFAMMYESPSRSDAFWIRQMTRTVVALDPSWRTAYFYGGSMLRIVDDIEASDEIFKLARETEELSDDPFFPFALAINAWLHHEDPELASRYLSEAAELPGAPKWYRAAAVGIVDKDLGRRAGIELVRRQLEQEEDDKARDFLEDKLARLLHEEYSEQLTEALAPGDAVPAGTEVVVEGLPPDPLGGHWIVGADRTIKSNVAEQRAAHKALHDSRHMLTRPKHSAP